MQSKVTTWSDVSIYFLGRVFQHPQMTSRNLYYIFISYPTVIALEPKNTYCRHKTLIDPLPPAALPPPQDRDINHRRHFVPKQIAIKTDTFFTTKKQSCNLFVLF